MRGSNRNHSPHQVRRLGSTEDIQSALVKAFPGVRFTYDTYWRKQKFFEALMNLLLGGIERALNRPSVKGCYGDYDSAELKAQFSFALEGANQIDVEMWGTDAAANARFGELTRLTSWTLKYD